MRKRRKPTFSSSPIEAALRWPKGDAPYSMMPGRTHSACVSAWSMIAAELVFGASSGSGGVGWYIFQNKNMLDIPNVFAGLLTVIIFGLLVENLIFKTVEKKTISRWGMQS